MQDDIFFGSNTTFLDQTDSTNHFLNTLASKNKLSNGALVSTDFQRDGRGERGNHWESEAEKNLLLSYIIYPKKLHAQDQFLISKAVALAVANTIRTVISKKSVNTIQIENPTVKIKWPNDIYIDDMKVSGILIENTLKGYNIDQSIVGIGLNVNQEIFNSDAPNPLSIRSVCGVELNREWVLEQLNSSLNSVFKMSSSNIDKLYIEQLYRHNSYHQFRDKDGLFKGAIQGVDPYGRLIVERCESKTDAIYDFKEIAFII